MQNSNGETLSKVNTTSIFVEENYELILMCKDNLVLNISTYEVLNKDLLPGLVGRQGSINEWFKLRRSSNTNVSARKLKNLLYPNDTLGQATVMNRALSLSDCYWIKKNTEHVTFREVSPYFEEYWEKPSSESKYTAKPTMHLNGYRDKQWISSTELLKPQCKMEFEAHKICKELDIPVCEMKLMPNVKDLKVINFTNENIMLESCDMSGVITEDNITTDLILMVFGLSGFKMILLDALIGNGDRHSGNFGFLRDANTGNYIGMAPLYDFDHMLDSKLAEDVLTKEVILICKENIEYREVALNLCNRLLNLCKVSSVYLNKARYILRGLGDSQIVDTNGL